jgi:VWFA-related protein
MGFRSRLVVLLSLTLALAFGLAPAHAQEAPAPGARTLQIDVVASDDGRPVTDLKRDDIEVWIGGLRMPIQEIAVVTPEAQEQPGRLIVLLLDDMTLEPAMVGRGREIAKRFASRMLPGDRMAVTMLDGRSTELTSDPVVLNRQIDSWRQTLGIMPLDRIGEHVIEKVGAVARGIVEASEPRKTIVAIGSSWLLDTPVPPAQIGTNLRDEWFAMLRALAVADATYYVIDPRGVGGSRQSGQNGLAFETGGYAFANTNDFTGAVDRILHEAGHYYRVSVPDPPVGQKAALRDVDIKVLRKNIDVRARRSIPGGALR